MKQKKWLKALVVFLGAMSVMGMLSRAAASVNTARVVLQAPQNQLIAHRIRGSGQAEGTGELAVFAKEGLLVEQVLVKEGQMVERGEALLALSEDSLGKAVREQESLLLGLEEKAGDLDSQERIRRRQWERDRAFAAGNLQQTLTGAQVEVDNAQAEVNVARERLERFYQDRQFSDGSLEDEELEKQLCDDLRLKQEMLNQVAAASRQSVIQAQKAEEDAGVPLPLDSTMAQVEREMEAAREELASLEALLEKGGVVEAPEAGVVKSIGLQTGGRTMEEAALLLYQAGTDLCFRISLEKEALPYVTLGEAVKVTDSRGEELKGAVAEALTEEEGETGTWSLTIRVPGDLSVIGQSLTAEITREEGPYESCVPLGALHKANDVSFVYVAEPRDTVLGQELTARRVAVEVEDQNETTAALKSGSLASSQQVIVLSDRELSEGSRIRLAEK